MRNTFNNTGDSTMTDQAAEAPNVEAIIAKYIDLRDAIDAAKAAYNAKVAGLKQAQEGIEAYLMGLANQTGQTSFGCAGVGTAFITTENSCTVANKEAFMSFVREQDAWPLLDVKANKTNTKQYLDAHNELPPGVNWTSMKVIQIRRGK